MTRKDSTYLLTVHTVHQNGDEEDYDGGTETWVIHGSTLLTADDLRGSIDALLLDYLKRNHYLSSITLPDYVAHAVYNRQGNNIVVHRTPELTLYTTSHTEMFYNAKKGVSFHAAFITITEIERQRDTRLTRPAPGKVTQGYAPFHPAIDIANQPGTVIRAMHAGTVKQVGFNRNGMGNTVIIEGDNQSSVYGHLRTIHVKEGEVLAKGQPIGEMGGEPASNEKTTGSHLHVEYISNGKRVDPRPLWS